MEQNVKSWIKKGGLDFMWNNVKGCGTASFFVPQKIKPHFFIHDFKFCSTTFHIVPQKIRPHFLFHAVPFCSTKIRPPFLSTTSSFVPQTLILITKIKNSFHIHLDTRVFVQLVEVIKTQTQNQTLLGNSS